MKITKRQLRKMISELSVINPVQIDDHDELLFRIAMKAKDMMPANEVLGLDRDSFEDMVVYIYETHFDTTGEGWAPYEEDLIAIEDHLTIKDDLEESKKKTKTKMKITKRQLRRIIREIKLADMRDSTTEWYADASGEKKMVPSAPRADSRKRQALLAQYVSEYLAFSPPSQNAEQSAIEQVASDEGTSVERVQSAVDKFGVDISQWEKETI